MKAASTPGAAYEGVAVLPWLGQKLSFLLKPLFGLTSAECIAVPITALGAAGAAIGLVPGLLTSGLAGPQDIAVFTAMCMCWSGYLSTHVAMMSSLKCTYLTGRAIACTPLAACVPRLRPLGLCPAVSPIDHIEPMWHAPLQMTRPRLCPLWGSV